MTGDCHDARQLPRSSMPAPRSTPSAPRVGAGCARRRQHEEPGRPQQGVAAECIIEWPPHNHIQVSLRSKLVSDTESDSLQYLLPCVTSLARVCASGPSGRLRRLLTSCLTAATAASACSDHVLLRATR